MGRAGAAGSATGRLRRWLVGTGMGLLVVAVAVMWLVEVLDTTLLDDRLQRNGIGPRRLGGLDGVLWAPFLHSDVGHVFSNTAPLLFMGGVVSARGMRYWATVTVAAWLGGGLAVWALGGGSNHIGASGVVFGYFGALLAAAAYERRPAALGGALLAIFLYSGLVAGLVPQASISWEGHLFGLLAGVAAARALAERPPPRAVADDGPRYSWELDEPWLD